MHISFTSYRKPLIWTAKFIVFIPLCGYLVHKLGSDYKELPTRLQTLSPAFAIIPLLCLAVIQAVNALRQKILLQGLGAHLPFRQAFRIVYLGFFSNNFLPAGAGFDLSRLYFFRKTISLNIKEISAVILLDRILGLLALSIIAFASLTAFTLLRTGGQLQLGDYGLALLLVLSIPLVLFLGVLSLRVKHIQSVLIGFTDRFPSLRPLRAVGSILKHFTGKRKMLLTVLLFSITVHVAACIGTASLAYSIFGTQEAVFSLLFSPLVFLSSSIPVTPGNIGWTESVAEAIWTLGRAEGGLVILLTWRFLCVLFSFGGLPFFRDFKEMQGVVTAKD